MNSHIAPITKDNLVCLISSFDLKIVFGVKTHIASSSFISLIFFDPEFWYLVFEIRRSLTWLRRQRTDHLIKIVSLRDLRNQLVVVDL